jgi:hypothetical protein
MGLSNGTYRTSAGSIVTVSGKHSGQFTVVFEWFEEDGACIECDADPEPKEYGPHDWRLTWHCAYHEAGNAQLTRAAEQDAGIGDTAEPPLPAPSLEGTQE